VIFPLLASFIRPVSQCMTNVLTVNQNLRIKKIIIYRLVPLNCILNLKRKIANLFVAILRSFFLDFFFLILSRREALINTFNNLIQLKIPGLESIFCLLNWLWSRTRQP
jgi:hypothetical protein